jgi:FKBP-type peptidyl-prolyl cis-trans isomerase SlyD
MQIAHDSVVTLEYTLKDASGETIDSSDGEPLSYLHGHGELVPGLERALLGRKEGDSLQVEVAPEDAYGEHDPERIIEIARDELPDDVEPEIGLELSTDGPDGEPVTLWIVDIEEDRITLDGNHPLAGQPLHFSIKILVVRDATAEEREHGHVHGHYDEDEDEPEAEAPTTH